MLQLEHDQLKIKAELYKEIGVERMRQQTEQAKMEHSKLEQIREGKLSKDELSGKSFSSQQPAHGFDG